VIRQKLKKNNPIVIKNEFFGREKELLKFDKEVEDLEHYVLMYYGVGGIGKSTLSKKLQERCGCMQANIEVKDNNIAKFYEGLRKSFTPKIKFNTFDIVYIIYWNKKNHYNKISKNDFPFMEEGGVVIEIMAFVIEQATLGIVPSFISAANKYYKNHNIEMNVEELENMEPDDIVKKFHEYFVKDIKNDKQYKLSNKYLFFIDNYEVITNSQFVIDLISELSIWDVEALFVITGREKLKWEKYGVEWKGRINSIKLDGLDNKHSEKILSSNDIKNNNLIESIIKLSEGVPFFLELAIDTYKENQDSFNNITLNIKGQNELFDRFFKYLDNDLKTIIKALAICKKFNYEIFCELCKSFNISNSNDKFEKIVNYSFAENLDDKYFKFHNLMTESEKNVGNAEDIKKTYIKLVEYYDKKIITSYQKEIDDSAFDDLSLAIEYYLEFGNNEVGNELYNWLIKKEDYYNNHLKYDLMLNLYTKLLEKTTNPSIKTKLLNRVASLHKELDNITEFTRTIKKLKQLYQKPEYKKGVDYVEFLYLEIKAIKPKNKVDKDHHANMLTEYDKLLKEMDKISDINLKAFIITDYANYLRKYHRKQDALNKLLEFKNKDNLNEDILMNLYIKIALTYKDMALYDKAKNYILKVEEINGKNNFSFNFHTKWKAKIYQFYSAFYQSKNDLLNAEDSINKSLKEFKFINDVKGIKIEYDELARIHVKLGKNILLDNTYPFNYFLSILSHIGNPKLDNYSNEKYDMFKNNLIKYTIENYPVGIYSVHSKIDGRKKTNSFEEILKYDLGIENKYKEIKVYLHLADKAKEDELKFKYLLKALEYTKLLSKDDSRKNYYLYKFYTKLLELDIEVNLLIIYYIEYIHYLKNQKYLSITEINQYLKPINKKYKYLRKYFIDYVENEEKEGTMDESGYIILYDYYKNIKNYNKFCSTLYSLYVHANSKTKRKKYARELNDFSKKKYNISKDCQNQIENLFIECKSHKISLKD